MSTLKRWADYGGMIEDEGGEFTSYYAAKALEAERDALKARVAELEQSDNEAIKAPTEKVASLSAHETCACSIDTPEDVCMHHSPEVMRLIARVAELEAEVERLRVIELPEITNHPQAGKMWNLGLATLGWKGYEWSKEARALVALLNDGRSK